MSQRIKKILIYLYSPRTIIFLVALLNFAWFFSQSSDFHNIGSASPKISFCAVCPWYWNWSITNLASLSLAAAISILFARWQGYLIACLISSYQIIDWFNWIGGYSSYLSGLVERLRIVSEYDSIYFWELLDLQYFLALIIFITALIYLVISIFKIKQKPVISYP